MFGYVYIYIYIYTTKLSLLFAPEYGIAGSKRIMHTRCHLEILDCFRGVQTANVVFDKNVNNNVSLKNKNILFVKNFVQIESKCAKR